MTETIDLRNWVPVEPEPFDPTAPDADVLVGRMVRRLRALDARKARAQRVAEAEHAEITRWYTEQTEPIDREAANLRTVIESYALAVLERSGGRTKSVSFPAGTVKTRTADHWDWPDGEQLAALIMALDDTDMVRITKTLDKTAVKREADVTVDGMAVLRGIGSILPGIHVEQRTTVSIALSGEHETADDPEGEELP